MGKLYKDVVAGLKDIKARKYKVYKDEEINVQALRQRLGMTQEQFAQRFGVPLASLRNWEQKHRAPSGAIYSYMRVIKKNPRAVLQALGG